MIIHCDICNEVFTRADSHEDRKKRLQRGCGIWVELEGWLGGTCWYDPITSWQIDGETVTDFILRGSKIIADGDCTHEIKRRLLLGRKVMTNLDSILKSRDIIFINKGPSNQGYGFSSGHAWMWELDNKESWAPKNWCFWTVVLQKTLESPLDCKGIQPVHPKGKQSWVFIGRTDVETETPVFWPPDAKSWLIWKDPDVEISKAGGEGDDRGWDG